MKQCTICSGRGHLADECPWQHRRAQRLYVAGPMSGLPESNYPAFHDAAAKLRAMGYQVENPAENDLPAGSSWAAFMRAGITKLMTCDAIVLLPGCAVSRGARIEWDLAEKLGMKSLRLDQALAGYCVLSGRAVAEASLRVGATA